MSKKVVSVELIKLVAGGLGELNDRAVFVGGATVPFYLPKAMGAAARPTEDIDVVIEIVRTADREKFEALLRKKGFVHDLSEGAPICRWNFRDTVVDILSPDEKFMGFTNKWYAEGMEYSILVSQGGVKVKILTLPYFIATKIEAFKGRGAGDFMASPDIEDIVTVLDGLDQDLLNQHTIRVGSGVSKYLKKELRTLLNNRDFDDSLSGHVFDRLNVNERVLNIKRNIDQFLKSLDK